MKNILITGTNKGIGKSLKDSLAKKHNIFAISKTPSEENFFCVDLTDKESIQNLNFGDTIFDRLIFNAGVGYYGDFFVNNLQNYEELISLNLLSPIRLLYNLKENINSYTKIIFIGSIVSKKFLKNASVYTASKFGIRGLAGALKADGKKTHIINPRIVRTTFHDNKVEIDYKYETKIDDIINSIENIIENKEIRFEIDL